MDVQVSALEGALAREVMFVDHKGRTSASLETKQRKLLSKVGPLVRAVLEPDEKVLFLTEATSPFSVLEWLTTGWIITTVKRCVLAATDRRLLHMPAKADLTHKLSISEVRYADLQEAKVSSFLGGKLTLTYRDGKKETFINMRGAAAARLRQILEGRTGHGQTMAMASQRRYLCPRCARPLEKDVTSCPNCNLAFKTMAQAVKYSILLPGGGYFYTGHPVLGLLDALTETFLTFFFLFSLYLVFSGDPDGVGMSAAFGVLLVLEKLLTVYHASHYVREVMPADRDFRLA